MVTSILIVEPSTALRETLEDILALEGYQVSRAANGNEALRRIDDTPVDLIICYETLPDMTGQAFFQRLRENEGHQQINFLMVHASEMPPDLVEYTWVKKPFSIEKLLLNIESFDK
jgi:DNA-binding response OmpR family regulator